MELIGYQWWREGEELAHGGGLFDYAAGANGIFVRGRREHLAVSFPIANFANSGVRGLALVSPAFACDLPLVPEGLVAEVWRSASYWGAQGVETLFHLIWSPAGPWNDGWELVEPEQERSATTCRPLESGPGGSHERAILEIHSHHGMVARFSKTDDRDEAGFRLYGVIGRLPAGPEIRLRVGVYGHFWEIPAAWVMELPAGLRDCVEVI